MNDILKMLDWNNDIEIQREGREKAKQIECLSAFMQPMDKGYNKNVWENCALVLSEKEDDLLWPYLSRLLDWIQDLNWPGAIIIFERLKKYQKYEYLVEEIQDSIKIAKALNDEIWLENLSKLLCSFQNNKNQ